MKKDLHISFLNVTARVPASMNHFLCLTVVIRKQMIPYGCLKHVYNQQNFIFFFFCTILLMLGLFLQEE